MSEPGNTSPAEVLRAKRLEIVDDDGKVRAVLGTREEGIGGLSVFDESSGRVRARLVAGEIPEQGSGLSVFDTNGKPRAVVNMSNDADKSSGLILLDTEGKQRVGVGLETGGQAWLSISAAKKDRSVMLVAMDDGNVTLLLSGEEAPTAGLTLRVEAGKDPSADLGLIDRDGRAGVVLSERRSGPYVSLSVAALRLTRAQLRSPRKAPK